VLSIYQKSNSTIKFFLGGYSFMAVRRLLTLTEKQNAYTAKLLTESKTLSEIKKTLQDYAKGPAGITAEADATEKLSDLSSIRQKCRTLLNPAFPTNPEAMQKELNALASELKTVSAEFAEEKARPVSAKPSETTLALAFLFKGADNKAELFQQKISESLKEYEAEYKATATAASSYRNVHSDALSEVLEQLDSVLEDCEPVAAPAPRMTPSAA
jgi:hypothetical protein